MDGRPFKSGMREDRTYHSAFAEVPEQWADMDPVIQLIVVDGHLPVTEMIAVSARTHLSVATACTEWHRAVLATIRTGAFDSSRR